MVVLTWCHCSQLLGVGCTHLITGKGVCDTPDEGVSQNRCVMLLQCCLLYSV